MTLEELELQAADTEMLTAAQVAKVLNCDAQWLRDQARNGTFPLPFPILLTGKKERKSLTIPKRPFLRFMRGEDAQQLLALLPALIQAAQIPPEALKGWHYTVNGPTQQRRENRTDPAAPSKPAPIDWSTKQPPAPIKWPKYGKAVRG